MSSALNNDKYHKKLEGDVSLLEGKEAAIKRHRVNSKTYLPVKKRGVIIILGRV